MRRSDRQRDKEFALAVIDACEYGVCAFDAPQGQPYCLPLSMVRVGDELYFHCALEGLKLDLLRRSGRVCVSFVGRNIAAKDKFTTYFQSAVVTGQAREITDPKEKIEALRALCQKLTPSNMEKFDRAIAKSLAVTGVWAIHMEEIQGKEKPLPQG